VTLLVVKVSVPELTVNAAELAPFGMLTDGGPVRSGAVPETVKDWGAKAALARFSVHVALELLLMIGVPETEEQDTDERGMAGITLILPVWKPPPKEAWIVAV
jgi:hypothetical protein